MYWPKFISSSLKPGLQYYSSVIKKPHLPIGKVHQLDSKILKPHVIRYYFLCMLHFLSIYTLKIYLVEMLKLAC